jgi:hypothetical protein
MMVTDADDASLSTHVNCLLLPACMCCAGDERKRLLYEIAMDVKEWRRWRHAKAVAKAAANREKAAREQQSSAGKQADRSGGRGYNSGQGSSASWIGRGSTRGKSKDDTPQERWQQKVAKKKLKKLQK